MISRPRLNWSWGNGDHCWLLFWALCVERSWRGKDDLYLGHSSMRNPHPDVKSEKEIYGRSPMRSSGSMLVAVTLLTNSGGTWLVRGPTNSFKYHSWKGDLLWHQGKALLCRSWLQAGDGDCHLVHISAGEDQLADGQVITIGKERVLCAEALCHSGCDIDLRKTSRPTLFCLVIPQCSLASLTACKRRSQASPPNRTFQVDLQGGVRRIRRRYYRS